ncbi:MAG TPA: hypothetical protein PLB55_21735, partial [Prosthecobacter sp.]|nr:hypothetical protein [Prosthecobacter sp.]
MITTEMPPQACLDTFSEPGPADVSSPMCMQDDCRLFGVLLNETPQGILVIDDEGVLVFVNLAMNALFLPIPMTVGGRLGVEPELSLI